MEASFERIAIIGTGLIGGSWGLALKNHGFHGVRIGCDRPDVLNCALILGAIDAAEEDPCRAAATADLVILAAPVGAVLDLLPRIKSALSTQSLVTDAGSTKVQICRRAAEIFDNDILFLGGHPLAGKERSGIANAEATLFEGARYAMVPLAQSHLEDARVKAFMALVASFGAQPFVTDAASHDRAVAYLSHLPQLLSTSLAALVAESRDSLPIELAGAGFRDVTRLADSPYPLWRDICLTNLANIQEALRAFSARFEELSRHLSGDDLEQDFKEAAELRKKLHEL